ncbi:MFS transporter [Vibrio agarilyticus]|nr:MFS transporter [Vibrio agarilyticus]
MVSHFVALLGVLFIALNLRGPFTSVAPLLAQIMETLGLNASKGGFVTALPLIALAIFSPVTPKLVNRVGIEPSLIIALFCIAFGIVIRSMGSEYMLYLGTIILGAGIAFGNVLLPSIVKKLFPNKISVITSIYVLVMGIGATFSASSMVPLSQLQLGDVDGWQIALLLNLIFPVTAVIYWWPKLLLGNSKSTQNTDYSVSIKPLLKSPTAWYVTLALGINSFTFYSLAGWLPRILTSFGYTDIQSGYIYGLLQFSTILPGLILIPILSKIRNHVILIIACSSGVTFSLIGLLVIPNLSIFWVVLFGLSNCSTFIVALSFIGLRTLNSEQATALSGMAQSFGYGLAAMGPSLIGYFYTVTNAWELPLFIITIFSGICTIFSALAARKNLIPLGCYLSIQTKAHRQ